MTEVEKLRRRCDQLALELAHLDETEMEQVNIEQSLGRQQAYLQRLDKVGFHRVRFFGVSIVHIVPLRLISSHLSVAVLWGYTKSNR